MCIRIEAQPVMHSLRNTQGTIGAGLKPPRRRSGVRAGLSVVRGDSGKDVRQNVDQDRTAPTRACPRGAQDSQANREDLFIFDPHELVSCGEADAVAIAGHRGGGLSSGDEPLDTNAPHDDGKTPLGFGF
jgi:hypothetical protein